VEVLSHCPGGNEAEHDQSTKYKDETPLPVLWGCNGDHRLTGAAGGFCGRLERLKMLYRTDVPVSPARQRFDVARCFRRIAKHFANARNCVVQAVVKVDECISRPEPGMKLLPSHHIAGTFQQDLEHLEGLTAQSQPCAVLAQLAGTDIQFKTIEP
jgi:hypothetical protein